MPELPRQSYGVTVLGAGCDHRWPGTVYVRAGGTFNLAQDDASCPECGGNAGTVLFGVDEADEAGL